MGGAQAIAVVAAADTWAVVGSLGAAVGGIGAAIGGVAAWRAASASRASSRDALEALGFAIAPDLNGDSGIEPLRDGSETGDWWVRMVNESREFAATRLRYEAAFKDGHRVNETTERLGPGEDWRIVLRRATMPPAGPLRSEAGESAVLRYSDERGIVRYQLDFAFIETPRDDGVPRPSVTVMPLSDARRI